MTQLGSALIGACIVLVIAVAAVEARVSTAVAACAVPPVATVTFQTSCATIDVTDASCWTPHLPTSADVVSFPAGTSATMPFVGYYTPLSVQSVSIAVGATVTLNGGAIAVSQCLNVAGSLLLVANQVDNGTASSIGFAADPSVPLGTDCSVVTQGFSPRVCGPGQLYVSGKVGVKGLYASLWIQTTVAAAARVAFEDLSFLWGSLTNYGTVTSSGSLFLHGAIDNLAEASATFQGELRVDRWTKTPAAQNVSLLVTNAGTLTFNTPKTAFVHNFVSTRGLLLLQQDAWSSFVTLQIVNKASGQLSFNAPTVPSVTYETWGISSFDIVNYGTTSWSGPQAYDGVGLLGCPNSFGTGVVTNAGVLVANKAVVSIDVVSQGGTIRQLNGGRFYLGMSEKRKKSLRARGFVVTRPPTVILTDTTIESLDGTGAVVISSTATLNGNIVVGAGATLRNEIPNAQPLYSRASVKGAIAVHGRYQAGPQELFGGSSQAVALTVGPSGTLDVPAGSVVTIHSSAPIAVQRGGVMKFSGRVKTVTDEGSARSERQVNVSPLSFVVGAENVSGDFEFPSAVLEE